MRIERELMRGVGPLAVLKLLEARDMYGYELADTLATRTQGVLDMGQSTLYPMLYNLEAKGLVEAYWKEGAKDTGKDRKYYRLTRDGKRKLASDEAQWTGLLEALRSLGLLPAPLGQEARP
jgi:PadR family transcriptional regulator PadR